MIRRITHKGDTVTVQFETATLQVALMPSFRAFERYGDSIPPSPSRFSMDPNETLQERGIRLRRAADDFSREVHREIIRHLAEQGHLVE